MAEEERKFENKTLLVTGGAGFIGSNFIHYMLDNHPSSKIINLDKLTYAGNLDNLRDVENDSRYEFVHGDIRDKELVQKIYKKVHGVVHLAAETHVDRSIMDAGEFVLTDVFGSFVLFEAMRNSDLDFFIHVSTDEVYGSRDQGYFNEEDPLNPSSPYSASKTGSDRLAYSYTVTYDLPIIILRPSNNYGPYQYPEKFIPLFVTNALEDNTLPLYGKGTNVRGLVSFIGISSELTSPYSSLDPAIWIFGEIPRLRTASNKLIWPPALIANVSAGHFHEVGTKLCAARWKMRSG